MKAITFIVIDVVLHIVFWIGLPMSLLILPGFLNHEQFLGLLTRRIDSVIPLEGCQGTVVVPPLMRMSYLVRIQLPTAPSSEKESSGPKSSGPGRGLAEERPGVKLRVAILDETGQSVQPSSAGDGYPELIFGPTDTWQDLGLIANRRLRLERIVIRYSVESNCEAFLACQPAVRVIVLAGNEVQLLRFGLALLVISGPWVIITKSREWLRRKKSDETVSGTEGR